MPINAKTHQNLQYRQTDTRGDQDWFDSIQLTANTNREICLCETFYNIYIYALGGREILHWPIYSLDAYGSQSWAKLNPGESNLIQPSPAIFQVTHHQEPEIESEIGIKPQALWYKCGHVKWHPNLCQKPTTEKTLC